MLPKIICTYAFSAVLLFSAVYLSLDTRYEPTEEPTPSEQDAAVTPEKYTVKQVDGKISVFKGDDKEPLYTLDSPYVRDLPEYDRMVLEQGITADSKEELLKILEDYDY